MEVIFPQMTEKQANAISTLGLAHIGDCVYELCVRTMLCMKGEKAVGQLHHHTVAIVNATYQANAAQRILEELSPAEVSAFRRGRNAKVNSVPHNSSLHDYHMATGLETLFGWLYLTGKSERIEQLFYKAVMEVENGA